MVKVFERNDRIGGLLQYGIPTMKLSKEVVQRRVKLLEEEGVVFHTNVSVGKDYLAKVIIFRKIVIMSRKIMYINLLPVGAFGSV